MPKMHAPDPAQLQRIPAMPCGLYRTARALNAAEGTIEADRLIHLHDHRPEEWPTAHLPEALQGTRWTFEDGGIEVLDADFLLTLESLPSEGWYTLRRPVATEPTADAAESDGHTADQILPVRSLVLVGYNRQGHCILFPAQFGDREVRFASAGLRFDDLAVLDALEPVNFDVPADVAGRVVH